MNDTIGILGGMGPRATVQFEQQLLDRLPGTDQELPTIITINNGSIPDRSSFLLGAGDDPVPAMQSGLNQLQRCGAQLIAIPCNTACSPAIFDRLRAIHGIELLNLPQVTVEHVASNNFTKVYILATAGTVASNTYQYLCQDNNIDCVMPPDTIQSLVSDVIAAVKQNNRQLARFLSAKIKREISQSGCDAVILGCTELPLVGTELVPRECVAIDTLAVLADTIASRYTTTNPIKKEFTHDTRPIHA